MRVPGDLFDDIGRVDFLKCDVEEYETNIFPHLRAILRRFKPIVQVEIETKENRVALFSLMDELGYAKYGLRFGRLTALDDVEALSFQDSDFYFLPHAESRQLV